jgi:hypothetical protein
MVDSFISCVRGVENRPMSRYSSDVSPRGGGAKIQKLVDQIHELHRATPALSGKSLAGVGAKGLGIWNGVLVSSSSHGSGGRFFPASAGNLENLR